MNKKKVLFIMPSMFIGGAERSLLGLLDIFDYEKYDVNLFLYRHEGDFLSYIPKCVNLMPEIDEYTVFDVPIKSLLMSKKWRYGIARLTGKLNLKIRSYLKKENFGIWASMQYTSKSLQSLLPNIPGSYDLAVSFLGIPDTLINKVDAKKKVAWNHTDYSILGPDKDYDIKLYSQIDYVASVSDNCTDQLLKTYPYLKNKTITIENVLSESLLRRQAYEEIYDMNRQKDEIILLSIGRYSNAKNFDNVPFICKLIRERGINVKWYLIGYGGDEPLIRNKIHEAGMQDYVIILGKKENPYPYIRACDIYIQPSRYEGKCVTVREAQILNKPVVITNYPTSPSQLTEGYDGIVVPMDNEGCAKGIASLIQDKELQQRLIENTKKNDYTNVQELEKLYKLMEE